MDNRTKLPPLEVPPEQRETHAVLRENYDNGNLKSEVIYRKSDNLWDGIRRAYYRDSALWCEDVWREGKLWEIRLDFFPDGKPVEGVRVVAGNGHQKHFYESGKLQSEGDYQEGRKAGFWQAFYESGKLQSEGHYHQGGEIGLWRYFYENGTLKSEGAYEEKQKVDVWKYYNEKGELTSIDEHSEEGIYRKDFAPSGKLLREGMLYPQTKDTLVKDGFWRYYHDNGALKSEGTYSNDQPILTWSYYTENGELGSLDQYTAEGVQKRSSWPNEKYNEQGLLRKNQKNEWYRDGLWRFYYKSGNLRCDGSYANGEKIGHWQYFYENGRFENLEDYADGKLYQRNFSPQGQPKDEGPMIKDSKGAWQKDGTWRIYKDNGFSEEVQYKMGQQLSK